MPLTRNVQGITLVELLVVVLVTAIGLTVSVPAFQSLIAKQRLRGAVETLYGDLQLARAQAAKVSRNVRVQFARGADWWCYGMDDVTETECDCSDAGKKASCTFDSERSDPKVVTGERFKGVRIERVTREDGKLKAETTFGWRRGGTAGNATITLQDSQGHRAKVIISILGRVRISSTDLPGYPDR